MVHARAHGRSPRPEPCQAHSTRFACSGTSSRVGHTYAPQNRLSMHPRRRCHASVASNGGTLIWYEPALATTRVATTAQGPAVEVGVRRSEPCQAHSTRFACSGTSSRVGHTYAPQNQVSMHPRRRCHASVAEVHRAPRIDATLVGPTQGWPLHATEPANTQGVRGSVLEDPRARDSSSAWESLAGVPRPSTGSGPAATAPRGCRCAPSGELVPTSPEPPHGPPGPLHRMSSRTQSGQASGVANAQ